MLNRGDIELLCKRNKSVIPSEITLKKYIVIMGLITQKVLN